MVQITPEIQKQLDEQKKSCIFCKMISGEMPSTKVYEDKKILAVLDINPASKGHMIILPKEHFPIMPYLPTDTFSHMFGMAAPLVDALKKSLLYTGANVFVANGAVAGQQSPHFLIHVFGRDEKDKINCFDFSAKKQINSSELKQANDLLSNNIPLMMKNHFGRVPNEWHKALAVKTAGHLEELKSKGTVVYEDEKVLVLSSNNPQCIGHLEIYSQEHRTAFDHLDKESAAHMFYVASFCATAVFEGLGAQGTNIILKTGVTVDNANGRLVLHVLPRRQDDGLNLMWESMKEKPDASSVADKIRNKTFILEEMQKPKSEKQVVDLDKVETIIIDSAPISKKQDKDAESEIADAIKGLKKK